MKIEKFVHLNKLFSTYQEVLTEKQKEILSLMLEEDYSLGEISEAIGISRQAVHDTMKRTEKTLRFYEEKIGLLQYEEHVNGKIESLLKMIRTSKSLAEEPKLKTEMIAICEELLS